MPDLFTPQFTGTPSPGTQTMGMGGSRPIRHVAQLQAQLPHYAPGDARSQGFVVSGGVQGRPNVAPGQMGPTTNQVQGMGRSVQGMMGSVAGNTRGPQFNPYVPHEQGGGGSGVAQQYSPAQGADQAFGAPSLAQVQAEMARRNVGAQLGQDPRNAALSGYMMGK